MYDIKKIEIEYIKKIEIIIIISRVIIIYCISI